MVELHQGTVRRTLSGIAYPVNPAYWPEAQPSISEKVEDMHIPVLGAGASGELTKGKGG